jgi:hypothetical protein
MQLNELIEEYSMPTISRQTRLSVENLEHLVAREWDKLPKVQALGFISILEREYRINLSGLRKECKEYYDGQSYESDDISFIVAADTSASEMPAKRSFYKIGGTALLLAAGYLAWYAFFSGSEQNSDTNASKTGKESFLALLQLPRTICSTLPKTIQRAARTRQTHPIQRAGTERKAPRQKAKAVKAAEPIPKATIRMKTPQTPQLKRMKHRS